MKKISWLAVLCVAAVVALSGCKPAELSNEQQALLGSVTDISGMALPEGTRVVALGEGTHGTAEYLSMRKDVFMELVESYGCRTFILEASFGGCLKVNDYIQGKENSGTARENLKNLDFWVYNTREFEELLKWMREYNESAQEGEKLKFYGFDLQDTVHAKERLLKLVESVYPEKAKRYEELLEKFSPETIYTISPEDLAEVGAALDSIMEELYEDKAAYIEKTGEYDYNIAFECAKAQKEFTEVSALMSTKATEFEEEFYDGTNLRDKYMAERVKTIMELEDTDMVFITGHNTHVAKRTVLHDGLPNVFTSMGEHLKNGLSENEYFAIGSAFIKGKFSVIRYRTGRFEQFYIEETNPFVNLFKGLDGESWYADINKLKGEAALKPYLNDKNLLIDIGSMYFPENDKSITPPVGMSPRRPTVLNDSWDALLVFKKTHSPYRY